jgi:hypothetical protein
MSERRRILVFAALVTLIAGGAGAFLVWNARGSGTEAAVADRASILEIVSVPHIVFLTGGSEEGPFDQVAIAPLADLSERAEVGVVCDRIGMAVAGGICIRHRTALGVEYRATFVDNSFAVRGSSHGPGIPSRARISPDGRYAAATSFVTGDSYLVPGEFSTTSTIYDTRTGKVVERTLERFVVSRDGQRFEPRDRNFWGVTFAKDGRTFFATMGTGAQTYLVRGDLGTRRIETVQRNVECPSLSPDEHRVAYKKRRADGAWRFTVLDLDSGRETALAETRSIDDQLAWLDSDRVLYGAAGKVWVTRADGRGKPSVLLHRADSPTVVRPV